MKTRTSEKTEQELLVSWFRLQYPQLLMFAIPNGGSRHMLEAVNLARGGVLAGVPDLMLAKSCCGFNALFIEMKRRKESGVRNAVVSSQQKNIIVQLLRYNFCAVVCYGFSEAKEVIEKYLAEELTI